MIQKIIGGLLILITLLFFSFEGVNEMSSYFEKTSHAAGVSRISTPQPAAKPHSRWRKDEHHSFYLRPGEQKVMDSDGGLIKNADWYDVFTVVILDFGSSTKKYTGWSTNEIYIPPSEMRRAKKIVYLRPTVPPRRQAYGKRTINRRVAGYDITIGNWR
jgi:hypothetical protein